MQYSVTVSPAIVNKAGKRLQLMVTTMILAVLVILPGCATYSSGFARVENAAANHDLDGAITLLDGLKLSKADETLLCLNKGTLLHLQGKYAESNQEFETAKNLMESLAAISVTEQTASVAVNDTMKAYEGQPTDQLLLYSFAALNYLQMGDVEAAAVEARQFDVKQGLITSKNPKAVYLGGAFVRYLNGMVYEAAREKDSARIEMQKALKAYQLQQSGFEIPQGLLADLSRLKQRKSPPSEVVFVLHNGLGPFLKDATVRVPNPNPMAGTALLSLSIPEHVARPAPVHHVVLTANTVSATSERVEDINDIAAKSLTDRMPTITARAVSRLVAKNLAAGAAKDRSGDVAGSYSFLVNAVIDVAAIVSEMADTRSWSLLPASIDMARLSLPAGTHNVTATYYDTQGNVLDVREYKDVVVKKGEKSFLSDYYLRTSVNPVNQTR